jgi:hypothetical protein
VNIGPVRRQRLPAKGHNLHVPSQVIAGMNCGTLDNNSLLAAHGKRGNA